ncbi:MAG: hypothetical protein ACQETI_10945 [Halobacteriota archaeon]
MPTESMSASAFYMVGFGVYVVVPIPGLDGFTIDSVDGPGATTIRPSCVSHQSTCIDYCEELQPNFLAYVSESRSESLGDV